VEAHLVAVPGATRAGVEDGGAVVGEGQMDRDVAQMMAESGGQGVDAQADGGWLGLGGLEGEELELEVVHGRGPG
jgi:hypothetical protein